MFNKLAKKEKIPQNKNYFEPDIDIYEKDNKIYCLFDMPGVEKNNVDIRFDKGNLTVTGTITDYVDKSWNTISSEYRIGNYRKTIAFPDTVDTSKIEAVMENGILNLELPKKEEVEKSIEIKVK